jgi:hypothetical protein
MKPQANLILCVLLSVWQVGCGDSDDGPSELVIACNGLCESVRACANEIDTIVDLNECEAEFCESDPTFGSEFLVEGGSQACNAASAAYMDCATGMSCQQYDDTGILSLFSGANAIGCESEASSFRFACIINP